MRTFSLILATLATAQCLSAAVGDAYMPGRLSVCFFEHPHIEREAGQVNLGAAFEHVFELYPLLDIQPLIPNVRRNTVPDLSLQYLLQFDPDLDMEAVAATFESTGKVEFAEPDYIMPVTRTPDDPSIGSQWYLSRMDCYDAWDLIPDNPDNPDMVIAIIDSGVDWNHPDLINNIWVNPGEDLDNDGVVSSSGTPGDVDDRNGVDDDANGYIDDFYGWDWVVTTGCSSGEDCDTPDNNPMDFNGHGTHCSGIAAATTNNDLGVASAAWDSRIMCLRAGYDAADGNGYVIQSAAASAIYYAVENGAKIISMSFGGSGTIRNPATFAYNSGLITLHAAGNDNSQTNDALDFAQGMISVASTTSSDCKSDFSNHGTWVDISAPGSNIYSTIFNNTYASLYGTSMACPNVASVAALLWWNNPELSNSEVRSRLLGTVDNIYNLPCNSDYIGLLGTGRVNAYKALMNIRETQFDLLDLRFSDTQGGYRYLPGDTLRIDFSLENTGINPTEDLTISISTEDAGVTVLTPEVSLPQLPDGSTYHSTDNDNWAGFVLIDEVTDGRFLQLEVVASSPNAPEQSGELELMLGMPAILLYDDSDNDDAFTIYYDAMVELGWIFDWYQSSSTSFPMLDDHELAMEDYGWTLYASGENESTLDEAEQSLLTDYVNAGHGLVFTSQYADQDIAGTDFFANVLEAVVGEQVNETHRSAFGVEGAFTEGEMMILQGAGGANNQNLPITEILPADDGETIYLDNNQEFSIGIHNGYDEDGRVAYLNFALEAASGLGGTVSHSDALLTLGDYLFGVTVSPDADLARPSNHQLGEAWPNPFNPVTQIAFNLAAPGMAELKVFNVLGQEVATLASAELAAGRHQRSFDATLLPSGLYLAQLRVDGAPVDVKKLMLVR